MKQKFLNKSNVNPQLDYDLILFDDAYPVLFTCVDKKDNLYICTCHCATAKKREWVIAQTTPQKVIELLTDEITIRDIFESCKGKSYIATMHVGKQEPEVQSLNISEMPSDILPTAGYYMESDPGEFDEEIAVMETRLQPDFHIVFDTESFNVIVSTAHVRWLFQTPKAYPDLNQVEKAYTVRGECRI